MKRFCALLTLLLSVGTAFAQTEEAYGQGGEQKSTGLIDPSRFSINHAMSFGMLSSSGVSGVKSQSLYTTMMQYEFASPVTLNLNFGLPIHSTFSSAQNLTTDNLQSMEYFKSMPMDMSLTWKPKDNLMMRLSVVRQPEPSFNSGTGPYFLSDDFFSSPRRMP